MENIELDGKIAAGITLSVLKDQRTYLKSDLAQWKKNPKSDENPTGYWMHPDDVVDNMQLIAAMDLLIGYFGGKE